MPRRRNRQKRPKVCPNDGQWSVGGNPLGGGVKNTGKCVKSDKEYGEMVVVRPQHDHTASLQRESNADDENRTTTRTNIISCKINTKSSCELWQQCTQNTHAISLKRTAVALGEDQENLQQCDNVGNVVNLSGDAANGMMGQQQSNKKSNKRKSPNPEYQHHVAASPPAQQVDDVHSEEYYEANCDSFKCTDPPNAQQQNVLSDNDSGCEFSERLREDNADEETEEFHCVETTFNFNPIYNSNLVCNTEDGVKSDTDRVNSAFDDGNGASNQKYDMMPHINGETPTCLPDIVGNGQMNLAEKRGLVTQEAHFSTQLDAAEKEVTYAQSKITELQLRIDELEREIANKTWAIDRLQAELVSAQKEDECVRRKLRLQEAEMGVIKTKASDREDDLRQQYTDLEVTHSELQIKLKDIQHFTSNLQVQLAEAQNHAETCKKERDKLLDERVEEQKLVQDTLDSALTQRDQLEAKFEQLRNVNQEREERLMEDCEWKMRGMQKKCKDRLEAITKEHQQAMETNAKLKATAEQYMKDLKRLKTIESEANALRGLTSDQRDSLASISSQLSDVKTELEAAKVRAEQEIRNAQKIKTQCQSDLIDERRKCHMKLEETRMQISMQWENKLLQEMMRLKFELESIYTDERKEALEKLKKDFEKELADLVKKHSSVESALRQEISDLEETLKDRIQELRDVSAKCDKQTIDARIYVDRSDRNNQQILDREIQYREEVVAKLEEERNADREDMERQFSERLAVVSEEFATELCNSSEELEIKHKKALQVQYEQLMVEKDEALQALELKHKQKISCLETKMKELEITHQREVTDMERNYSIERSTREQRDGQHAQEIDTLHRKCRCLTKLFEEMRMRYERRDPRQEDVRQIAELKEKVEQQERDLHKLTEVLREMQIAQFPQETPSTPPRKPGRNATRKNRDIKNKMTNCDVIYEEEQEGEQPVDAANGVSDDHKNGSATEA